jgi:hypothetical protein
MLDQTRLSHSVTAVGTRSLTRRRAGW